MINYLIIDDEPIAHDIIKGYCDLLKNMQLIKHCYDAFDALEFLRTQSIDLIFLDLNLPKLKGFDFLRTLNDPPKVIVTTAYQDFALEGYELNVVDYLLKPFSFERFLQAVNKCSIKTMPLENNIEEKAESIYFYSNKQHIHVKRGDIIYIEAAGNYCKIVLNTEKILVRDKISLMLEKLNSEKFIRIHKSFIVHKDRIGRIEGNRMWVEEQVVPIGPTYKQNVTQLLK